jgi:uncharacterized membrane protein
MKAAGNLWAVAYNDTDRAEQLRAELRSLEEGQFLLVEDMAVVVRAPDGSFRIDREPLPVAGNMLACSLVGFLAGLVVLAPVAGAAIGALVGGAGSVIARVGIADDFIREVTGLMQPGTSTLFLLDAGADMDVVCPRIRGLGGTVVKTNVDAQRAKEIQAALAASPAEQNR